MKGSIHPEVLDRAVQRLKAGEELAVILAEHPSAASDLQPLLAMVQQLEALRAVDMPSREHQTSDRARFLNEVRNLRAQTVSPNPLVRLKRWIARPFSTSPIKDKPVGKEKRVMVALLLKIILVLGLGLGSAGGTVALAEQSLPGSPLYPVKLVAEQLRISTTPNLADRAFLYLAQAQVRVREMEALMQQRRSPNGIVLEQLRMRLENALQLASGLPDPEMIRWLTQARETVRTQQETLARLCQRQEAGATDAAVLCRASALAQQAREQIEAGLRDPQTFRHRHSLGLGNEPRREPTPAATPPVRPGSGQPGDNPECPECTPQGDQHRYGPRPAQPAQSAEPARPAQPAQPPQPGPGQPGGNSECPECTPQGDQNQHRYGPGPTATPMWQRMSAEEALRLMHAYEHQYEYEHQYRLSAAPTPVDRPTETCDNCQPGGNAENMGGSGGADRSGGEPAQHRAGGGSGSPSGGGGSSDGGSSGSGDSGGSSGGGSGGSGGSGGGSGGGSSGGNGGKSGGGGRHGK
ncbi:MAG: hypothetical protein DDG58_05960 [Ardenticatenia bacterium]|jgi:hypothetical protein|nr:MAG: hypothetical protein DDG58_05960 [Ardenticatenia bacterium]